MAVSEKMQSSPFTRSSRVSTLFGSSIPIFFILVSSSSVCGRSFACMSPPRHLSPTAARTPSGAPPGQYHMNAASLNTAVYRRNYITICDQTDSCACFSGFSDNAFMTFPVKNNNCQVRNLSVHCISNVLQIFCYGSIDVDTAFALGPTQIFCIYISGA